MTPVKIHLLKKGEFRAWCVPNRPPGPKMTTTIYPSKATCLDCLGKFRFASGKPYRFLRSWTKDYEFPTKEPIITDER